MWQTAEPMERSPKALVGISVSEKLSERMLGDDVVSSVIREMRTRGNKLADIGKELRQRSLVEQSVGEGVLVSAISKAARRLIGDELSREVAAKNKYVVTAEDLGDGWKRGQVAATVAAAKQKGHYWEYEHDRQLAVVADSLAGERGIPWEEVAWVLEHQHGILTNAKGCRMRYYKITRSEPDAATDSSEEPQTFHIDDYR